MPQDPFQQKKDSILAEIRSSETDLSPKGTIDELCLPIMDLINSHKDMVTTSSCSGRVSVFVEGNKVHEKSLKTGGKGEGGRWLFVTHDYTALPSWMDKFRHEIEFDTEFKETLTPSKRYILYKFEPFILHVKCRDFQSASKLFNAAMSCGFRESGIGSNNIVALRINIKLDIPIGYLNEATSRLVFFVNEKYIELIDGLALGKFKENTRKMKELYQIIENQIINPEITTKSTKVIETKEERRERKRREGLLKQRMLLETQNADLMEELNETP
ncbi:LAFE_0D01662g1_1 [Lachancea fermentati]|uniref:tRNA wybutosine-synthesizing protein 3 n=1 Tax=Lachancea fermentati TaxID=4955 RepID=A0A1G4MAS2_LACFM|nr:LAFE_0D01662g1_1 [Lachancea fermentati]